MQRVITQDEICQTSYIIFNIYTKCPRSLMTVSGYRLREKKINKKKSTPVQVR